MTQIVPALTVFGGAALTAMDSAPAARPEAWLKEFERARWQAQPRYKSGEGGAGQAGTGQGDTQSALQGDPAVTLAEREPMAEWAGIAHAQAGSPGVGPAWPASTAAFLARASAPSLPPGWSPLLPGSDPIQHELLRLLRASTKARAAGGEPWSARNVHVQDEGEAWGVWIRDADITPQRVQDLLQTIEHLAAQGGQRKPLRLTVNGQPFAPAAHPLSEPHPAGERRGN